MLFNEDQSSPYDLALKEVKENLARGSPIIEQAFKKEFESGLEESLEGFPARMQAVDDYGRRAMGKEPRPWKKTRAYMEKEADFWIAKVCLVLRLCDEEQRKVNGLPKREWEDIAREIDEEVERSPSSMFIRKVRNFLIKWKNLKRMEKGLPPLI